MSIMNFIGSLLPSFKKDTLRQDIHNAMNDIHRNTIPAYKSAISILGRIKFKDAAVIDYNKDFMNAVKPTVRGNYIVAIENILQELDKKAVVVERYVERYYTDEAFRSAMSPIKVSVLQYIEAMSFASRYARKLLSWTLTNEANAVEGDPDYKQSMSLTDPEISWLQKRRYDFFTVMKALGGTVENLDKTLSQTADIVLTPDNFEMVTANVEPDRIDPFGFGFLPVWLNPVYHIGMKVAEYQAANFAQAEEEKKMLEIKVLNLEQQVKGKSDARLQEALSYNKERLKKMEFKLRQMEENYA